MKIDEFAIGLKVSKHNLNNQQKESIEIKNKKIVFTKAGFDMFEYPITFGFGDNNHISIPRPTYYDYYQEDIQKPEVLVKFDKFDISPDKHGISVEAISSEILLSFVLEEKGLKLRTGNWIMLGPYYGFRVEKCINSGITSEDFDLSNEYCDYPILECPNEKIQEKPELEIEFVSFTELDLIEGEKKKTFNQDFVDNHQPYIIGKKKIKSAEIADKHCEIWYNNEIGWFIRDLTHILQESDRTLKHITKTTSLALMVRENIKPKYQLKSGMILNISDFQFKVFEQKAFMLTPYLLSDDSAFGVKPNEYKFDPLNLECFDDQQNLKDFKIGYDSRCNLKFEYKNIEQFMNKIQCSLSEKNGKVYIKCHSENSIKTLKKIPKKQKIKLTEKDIISLLPNSSFGFFFPKLESPLMIQFYKIENEIKLSSEIKIDKFPYVIGRKEKINFEGDLATTFVNSFKNNSISQNHCQIHKEDDQYFLEDISSNGTFVTISKKDLNSKEKLIFDSKFEDVDDYELSSNTELRIGNKRFTFTGL